MSDSRVPGTSQVGLRAIVAHPTTPTAAAAVCLLLAMVLPLVTVTVRLGGMPLASMGLTGSAVLGLLGWLGVAALVAALAARTSVAAAPYRTLADRAALVLWTVLVGYAAYQAVNPVPGDAGAALEGMGSLLGGSGRPGQGGYGSDFRRATERAVSLGPAIGLAPFLAAGPLAWLGMRRARTVTIASSAL